MIVPTIAMGTAVATGRRTGASVVALFGTTTGAAIGTSVVTLRDELVEGRFVGATTGVRVLRKDGGRVPFSG